jgi:hypothetical protein
MSVLHIQQGILQFHNICYTYNLLMQLSHIKWLVFLDYVCIMSSSMNKGEFRMSCRVKFCGLTQFTWYCLFFPMAQQSLVGQGLPIIKASRSHWFRHTTVGRTPLDEWSVRRRDLYLTTHNTHKRQASMPPALFEPAISASERPQTHVLDRAATVIGTWYCYSSEILETVFICACGWY